MIRVSVPVSGSGQPVVGESGQGHAAAGLLRFAPNPHHGRAKLKLLTDKGREVARPLRMTARTYTRLLAQLQAAEKRALAASARMVAGYAGIWVTP